MKKQDYHNHIFYYWPHHFFFYGAVIIGFVLSGVGFYLYPSQRMLWAMMAFLVFLVGWLAFMTRQHYALGNQNRTVRLEMRIRYYILTGKRFEDVESKLSFNRIAALRFAPDDELIQLIDAAIAEQLSVDEIKRRIKNWLPDTKRV
jgi:hypothetical protein